MYRCGDAPADAAGKVRLLGSGTILREVIAAAELLADDCGIASDVYSVTSFTELARDARDVERGTACIRERAAQRHVERCLAGDARSSPRPTTCAPSRS